MVGLEILYKNCILKEILKTKSDPIMHHNVPNYTVLKNFLGEHTAEPP